jgi:Tol biopolymer transport system component
MQIKSRTFFIILGIMVFLILGGGVWLLSKQKNTPESDQQKSIRDFFPFGRPATILPGNQNQQSDNATKNPPEENTPATVKNERMKKVWDGAVAGYTLIEKDVPIDPLALSKDEVKTITPTFTFTKTLSTGSNDPEVKELEKILNQCPETQIAATGAGSPGKEGTVFSAKTKAALTKFQEKFPEDLLQPLNRTKGSGTLDTLTRNKLNQPWPCTLFGVPPKTEKKWVIRFVEKGNGNIHDAYVDTLEKKRLTNTTIPRVAQAIFVNNGTQVLLRYLRDDNQTIDTFLGTLPKETWGGGATPGTISGIFLEPNIFDVSVSPDGKRIFFLAQFAGGIIGVSGNPDGSDRKEIFTSPFMGWLASWPTGKDILVTAKASGYATGYAFRINPDTKLSPEKVLGPVVGLTTLPSSDFKTVLFSRNTSNGPQLGAFDVANGSMKDFGVSSLPEKCVWSKDSSVIYCGVPTFIPNDTVMPDSWYQGMLSFSDTIQRLDQTGILPNQTVIDPTTEIGERVDAINLSIAPDGKSLYFINKRDDTLWQLKL